jgi:Cof subfamily protein (haloacid dehalogenase superfamily)
MIYKLAAIDLDGTLLHSGTHGVTDGNAAAVREAARNGASIVLASGRQWATINKFAAQLGLAADAPIIAYNGAMIRTHGGDIWFHQPLPADAAAKIVAYCGTHGYHLNYYLDDDLYVRDDDEWADIYRQRTGTIAHITGDLGRFDGQQPTKILLIDTLETTDRLLAHFQAEFGDTLYITKTEDEYLEFMDPDINKGRALAEVAGHLGFAAAECIAFGDSFNDMPMLQWAGLGVAMGNARPEIKAAAGLIAPPADDDGVGKVLAQLFPVHPQHE